KQRVVLRQGSQRRGARQGMEGRQWQDDLWRERRAEDVEAGERPDPAQALVQADDTDRAVASAVAERARLARPNISR
ncbi:hypothetical protein ACLBQC_32320, partial [Klebsiella pneumoniae]|uniref:hypothetical protein n=1 Tax=Klebsiella pneumoniae TaxID=573 RepID=UPI0039692C9F